MLCYIQNQIIHLKINHSFDIFKIRYLAGGKKGFIFQTFILDCLQTTSVLQVELSRKLPTELLSFLRARLQPTALVIIHEASPWRWTMISKELLFMWKADKTSSFSHEWNILFFSSIKQLPKDKCVIRTAPYGDCS